MKHSYKRANIYAARASSLLDAGEQSYKSQGPVLTAEGLAELLVRQSLQLDLSDLVQVPEHKYVRSEATRLSSVDSVALQVDKDALLTVLAEQKPDYVEDDATAKSKALDVAHDEDVSAWVSASAHYLKHRQATSVKLVELVQGVQFSVVERGDQGRSPLVKTWLALLLGGFSLKQSTDDFYCLEGIWVQKSD